VSLERLQEEANGDLVYPFTHPWADGTTGIRLAPLELLEKLAALVPLPHIHRVRDGGCLAPQSALRHAIIPTPRQQGVDGEETPRGTPDWTWARRLKRGFALEMGTGPLGQPGVLRLIAVITQGAVISKILRHLQRSADPPPIAPVRSRQAPGEWVASAHDDACGLVRHVRAVAGVAPRHACALPAPGAPLRPPDCLQRAVAAEGRRWGTRARRCKRAFELPIHRWIAVAFGCVIIAPPLDMTTSGSVGCYAM
jgi:Putative transposase